jgi:predicted small secreted protein
MKNVQKFLACAVLAIGLFSMTSCNRGYGCPTDLKAAAEVATKVVTIAK